ncbi:uncharacterized protein DUF3139 [Staphylococcus auricularis]|uniref:DUF3139 domain-containing protein n=1 Tax=Staphylococcus auricularis TaxID=29379 RepID=UPI00193236CF|nr:DUF3139 domain-containing protein [Staphylococcus auricularis]MBM0868228.1 DUF3139 domain-containing protein [Staphylococcus auricularis]MCG7340758.1 DUF3139 domain-containing protein [Staphylococcus auricularis]
MKKVLKILFSVVIVMIIFITLVAINMHMYQEHEEAKVRDRVHHVFKQKGWDDKVESEENIFTFNTGYNDLEVTFKDEPYNIYTYSIDDDNRVTGEPVLKDEYNKKPKHYKKSYVLE